MCGIAGFIGLGEREILEKMTRALVHRGPDAEGFFIEENRGVYLGHRRLAILDVAQGGQPMMADNGELVIIFNGEIYNHLELRQELLAKGYQFQTDHSDTEVLLHAYHAWGEAMLPRLNGMWAFAIYDRRQQQLFLGRDRFGQKPLYYFQTHEEAPLFAFASELKALLHHPRAPREESLLALKKYFAYGYIPAPYTPIKSIFKLPAGHWGKWDLKTKQWSVKRYWEYHLQPMQSDLPADHGKAWGEELLERLGRAVKRCLITDVPLGVFLSGGIDSSAIAALATRYLPSGALKTFSVGFTDPSFDELFYARQVAFYLGSDHHEEILDLEKARHFLPELLSHLDEPIADSSLLPTWLLSRFARHHVTVALGGDGSDELFAGYDPFRALRAAKLYFKCFPKRWHPALRFFATQLPVSHRNISCDFKIKRFLRGISFPPSCWMPVWMGPLELFEINEYFGDHNSIEEIYSEVIQLWEKTNQEKDPINHALQFFARLYLQDDILAKVDRMSMQHSLEVRAPFLDNEVVDFVCRLPHTVKYRGRTTKWILKKALESLLPSEIIHRKKKGFGMPIGAWFQQGDIIPLLPKKASAQRFFKKGFRSHQVRKSDERLFLWAQHVLSSWQENGL